MPALTCLETLQKLADAILALQTGEKVSGINFGERSVQYGQNNLKDLMQLYGLYWRTCGPDSGLPNLSASNLIERGGPAVLSIN